MAQAIAKTKTPREVELILEKVIRRVLLNVAIRLVRGELLSQMPLELRLATAQGLAGEDLVVGGAEEDGSLRQMGSGLSTSLLPGG